MVKTLEDSPPSYNDRSDKLEPYGSEKAVLLSTENIHHNTFSAHANNTTHTEALKLALHI